MAEAIWLKLPSGTAIRTAQVEAVEETTFKTLIYLKNRAEPLKIENKDDREILKRWLS